MERRHRLGIVERCQLVGRGRLRCDVECTEQDGGGESRPIPPCAAVEQHRSIVRCGDGIENLTHPMREFREMGWIVERCPPAAVGLDRRPEGALVAIEVHVDHRDAAGDSDRRALARPPQVDHRAHSELVQSAPSLVSDSIESLTAREDSGRCRRSVATLQSPEIAGVGEAVDAEAHTRESVRPRVRHTTHLDRQATRQKQGGFRSERLRLRRWKIADAAFHRQLWEERDERVPARRRITSDGHPTLAEMQTWLRAYKQTPEPGLLVVEQSGNAVPVGYCGLVENSVGHPEEPELAFEFLREFWGRGFATEASRVIVGQAATIGYDHLASTVREWNAASLNVLHKLGFVATGDRAHDATHGDSLLLRLRLH